MTDSNKYKHLTFDERLTIQEGLNAGLSFSKIASQIGKHRTTVAKEVKRNAEVSNSSTNVIHSDTVNNSCPMLCKAPFVCNSCKYRSRKCKYVKLVYNAKTAQKNYETLLKESREGIPLQKESFYRADDIIYTCMKKGQKLYHISQTHNLGMSVSTVYRHLHRGYLSVSKLDFPRVVKFKQRKKSNIERIPKGLKMGRTHSDFIQYISNNNISQWVEMDTVIGRTGGKVLLTFDFTFCNFMYAMLLENKTAEEVSSKIKSLKQLLDSNAIPFKDVFPIILTDNGGEFSNVYAIENNENGIQETKLFFCDPFQSSQKPYVEKNHTVLRDYIPKGTSLDDYTQDTIDLILSHMNSIARKSLNGKTPYEMFTFIFGTQLTDLLNIQKIKPENVIQSPVLIM